MEQQIEFLLEKYRAQRDTIDLLIEATESDEEASNYKCVRRFIAAFIQDLIKLQET